MKLKSLLIPLLILTLAGCGKNDPSPTPEEKKYPEIEFDDKDFVRKGGTYSDWFTELDGGRVLTYGRDYNFAFSSNHATDKSYTVTSSNPLVAEVKRIEGDNKNFTLNALAWGDTIMTIEDADGMLVYRNNVRVRKAVAVENIGQALYDIDAFTTPVEIQRFYGVYTCTITDISPIGGILRGHDDYETSTVTYTYTLEYEEYISEIDCYAFKVTTISTTSQITTLSYFDITRALDCIYIYETTGLLTMVQPVTK